MDSLNYIMEYSQTAQKYHGNVTLMAWIHSSLYKENTNDCYLSSIDLHFQYKLEKYFPNIQAMVMQVSGNHYKDFEFYTLNENGRNQLAQCHKRPGTVHAVCSKNEYYTKANYSFEDLGLKVNNFMDFCQNPPMNIDQSSVDNILCVDGMDDKIDVGTKKSFIYPKEMISKFQDKARKYRFEIMAYVVGYEKNGINVATELIFPDQIGTPIEVNDKGKTFLMYI